MSVRDGQETERASGVCLVPYWWRDIHKPQFSESSPLENLQVPLGMDYQFDEYTYFLVVPNKQKRFVSEQAMSAFGVIIATPFTLLADPVVVPLAVLTFPFQWL